MSSEQPPGTLTLIVAIQRCDSAAERECLWRQLVNRYGPVIRGWAVGRGLNDADADDLTQSVFAKLARDQFSTFQREQANSARGYLRTVTHNAVCTWRAQNAARLRRETLAALQREEDLDAALCQEERLEELEGEVEVVLRTWPHPVQAEVFRRHHVDGQSVEEVAAELGISRPTAYRYSKLVLLAVVARLRAHLDA